MKRHRIAFKELPPTIIPEPVKERVKAQRQHVERVTFVFIALLIGVVFLFSAPDLTGRATTATTVNVTQLVDVSCNVLLTSGLNMVSLNCISNAEDRDSVLMATDTSRISAIYAYNNKQTDQWSVFNPSLPSYVVQDLDTFSRLKGYLFYMTGDTIIDYTGSLAAISTIPVFADNNLVGYPSILRDPLPGALTTIQDTYTRVRYYNGSAWLEYNSTDGSAGGLVNLTPTEAYWITTTATDSWQVAYNSS